MYYIQKPPFGIESMSNDAARWASTYGIFHWGITTWCIYLIPSLPMAYFLHVRRRNIIKVSEALMPAIGEKLAHGWVGRLLDILFIFGLLAGTGTTLGLAAPLINQGLHDMFGLPLGLGPKLMVLALCTVIFGWSAWSGLKKGIKVLSDLNLYIAIGLLAFVFILGPTMFMAQTGLESIGRALSNLLHMATYTESFGNLKGFTDSNFPQNWTMFYWAWRLVFSPTMGFFVARISKGRTIRQMIVGGVPLLPIAFLLMVSFMRAARFDLRYQMDYSQPTIHIDDFPRHDPWTRARNWRIPSESRRDQSDD